MQASAEQFKGPRPVEQTIARAYEFADLSSYPAKERLVIRAADLAFFFLIKLIGSTVRWQINGWENWEAATSDRRIPIYTIWHNRVFLSTYFWRHRRIVVMSSQSFDPTGFTIDGPKGPRYVAKMGAVLLAKKTGQPILPFTITAEHFWEVKKSWDGFQVPYPFSRARVEIAPPIFVPADADENTLKAKRDALQQALDEINLH